MSLESLRQLRRAGRKPDGVVCVLVGQRPKWRDDTEAFVHVRPDDRPEDMDWRPLVGLWAAMFVTVDDPALAARVLGCLGEAKAKFYGAADLNGTYPCVKDATEVHHRNLRATLENLCRT